MQFNSYQRVTGKENNFLYNQGTGEKAFKTERISALDLNVDMTKFRVYDPALGRFWQDDPLADAYPQESWTPYQFAYNNPIRYSDPYGDCPMCVTAGIGAGVGFVGGFVGGLITGKGWKKSLAMGVGGAVTGAVVGSGVGLIAAAGGVAGIGAAGTAYVVGSSSLVGAGLGNLAEQGTNNLLGEQSGFDENDFTLSMSLAIPEAMMGPVDDLAGDVVKTTLKDALTKEFTKDLSYQAQKKISKQLRKDIKGAAKSHGVKLTNKQARTAADKIMNADIETGTQVLNATIEVTNKAVDVSVVTVQNVRTEEVKEEISNE